MYLAGIVVFRVFFATLHTCKWKWRFCCNKKYAIAAFSLEKEFKKLKKEARTGGESTDDEKNEERLEQIFEKNEAAIAALSARSGIHDLHTYEGKIEAALEFAHDNKAESEKSNSDDSDENDMINFVTAELEETEDALIR